MKVFLDRYGNRIKGVISGWDRLAFRGTLRWLATTVGLSTYLSCQDILLKDFSEWAQSLTQQIRRSCEAVADGLGIRAQYLRSCSTDKEALARTIAQEDGIKEGPICMLSSVEPSYSPTVVGNKERRRLEVAMRQRKCVWVYFYFNDPHVGLGHVRLESWLPFTIKGSLNGRHWLEWDLRRAGIGYIKEENCFRWIADMARAQELADQQLRTDWRTLFDGFAQTYFPVMNGLLGRGRVDYYWSADATEWATDIVFGNTGDLDRLFPMLARYGLTVSDGPSVMRYLGKISGDAALPAKLAGEVRGDRRKRYEGICVKHWAGGNSVKIYNKAGNVLRTETTINHTRAFKTFRQPDDDAYRKPQWLPMRKGVADLQRRARISQASNERYLDMLAACPTDATFTEVAGTVCRPVIREGRRARALNPSAASDLHVLRFLTQGQWAIGGLRNRDLVAWLLPSCNTLPPAERKRWTARASRLLYLLRLHGLIQKIGKTHRYHVTAKGKQVATLMMAASTVQAQQLMEIAA